VFIDAFGTVDIEAHALFDEYGCRNFRVKASFFDPLAE
jgi:hypothetical protein